MILLTRKLWNNRSVLCSLTGGGGEGLEALGMLGGGSGAGGLSLRGALMGGMLDLPADDDDAMMELAIALSLHEEQGQAPADLGNLHPGLQGLVGGLPGLHRLQGLSGQVLHSLQVLASGGMPGGNAQANPQEVQQVRFSVLVDVRACVRIHVC